MYQPRGLSVHLFFVLSGRVLTASILKKGNAKGLGSAVIRRAFRLGVPVVGIIFVNALMYLLGLIAVEEAKPERYLGTFYDFVIKPFHFLVICN